MNFPTISPTFFCTKAAGRISICLCIDGCHFLATMQESNQRKWHRGGADREACQSCNNNLPFYPGFEPPSPMYPFRHWSEEWLQSNLSRSDICFIIIDTAVYRKQKRIKPVHRRGPGRGLGEGGSKAGYQCWLILVATKDFAVSASPRRLLWFVSCADYKK